MYFAMALMGTVEALISGHPWDGKKLSVARADRLREYRKSSN